MTRSGDVQSQRFHKNSLLIFITDFDGKVLYSTDEHSYKKRREHRDIQNRPQYKPDAEPQSRQKGAERSRPDGHDEFPERLSQSETKRVSYENSNSGNSQRIFVAVRKTDSKLRFEVHDYGNGIDKESLEHIWDRYFTKKQRKRNQNGSGLGLPISKEILTAHNALHGAESRENNSTVFWFEIRLA